MTCIIVKFKQDWLTRRHSARKCEENITSLSENEQNLTNLKSTKNADELSKQKVVNSTNDIVESNKRSFATIPDEPESRVNGDSSQIKRAKLE